MDYKNAGVDIEAGYESVELMKKFVKGTMRPEVLGGLGGFSGAFSLDAIKNMEEPVLLSGTDGCGTKVKLAFLMDKHDTIGIDAVAMCVNDIACAGGETALIESLEGSRGMPRLKPPFPAQSGYMNKPSNINNVEPFANVTWIINNGGEAFAAIGTETSKGTNVYALTG